LLKRYGSLDYVLKSEVDEALSLIEYAFKKQEEELIFQRWIPYQHISFDEFKTQIKPHEIKSDNEILSDVKEIITLFNRKGVKHGNI